jgi:hypothetical protein
VSSLEDDDFSPEVPESDDSDYEPQPKSSIRKRVTVVTSTADILPEEDEKYFVFGSQLMELFR